MDIFRKENFELSQAGEGDRRNDKICCAECNVLLNSNTGALLRCCGEPICYGCYDENRKSENSCPFCAV